MPTRSTSQFFPSAGMFFLEFQNIVQPDVHFVTTSSHFLTGLREY